MTVVDTPAPTRDTDDAAQLLFREARLRRRRRWLAAGIGALVLLAILGVTVGLVAGRGGNHPPRTAGASPAAATGATHPTVRFSLRPALCYAPAATVAAGQATAGPLPTCAPASQLTAAHLAVAPESKGYTTNQNIAEDPRFATYRSTPPAEDRANATVLLPASPGSGGPPRYVLGPAALTNSSVRSATAVLTNGQWSVDLTFTGNGASRWNALAEQQFHAIVGVDVDGRVISAPITQPTQSSFTSFGDHVQISGSFTKHQAEALAAAL